MPMPWTYRHASREFRAFLDDAKERMKLDSDNSAYSAVDAVLQVFRKRLTAQQGLDFASILPSVPRAIFVKDWSVADPPEPVAERGEMTREAQQVRVNHNLTPDNAIEASAWALRRSLDQRDLDRVLERIGPPAQAFWHVDISDPSELQQRIV
jgi:uncharacterized protein (DUF2267 family)